MIERENNTSMLLQKDFERRRTTSLPLTVEKSFSSLNECVNTENDSVAQDCTKPKLLLLSETLQLVGSTPILKKRLKSQTCTTVFGLESPRSSNSPCSIVSSPICSTDPSLTQLDLSQNQSTDLTSSKVPVSPIKTVFLLDWDDTLFATTFINECTSNGQNPLNLRNKGETHLHELKRLDDLLLQLFQRFLVLGHVVVITNAGVGWVQEISRRYLPQVFDQFISNKLVPIVYAQQTYTSSTKGGDNPFLWKINAFQNELNKITDRNFRAGFFDQNLQIVMLGDGLSDIIAANAVQQSQPHHIYLFVKFQEQPSLHFLESQLKVFQQNLLSILSCTESKLFYAKNVIK